MKYDPLDPQSDPFKPPATPTAVGCLHCGREYESYLIEWRVETDADGKPHGFWCCPTPGCDGRGFGFDILPLDPDYHDENGGWVWDDEDEEEFPDDAGGGGASLTNGDGRRRSFPEAPPGVALAPVAGDYSSAGRNLAPGNVMLTRFTAETEEL